MANVYRIYLKTNSNLLAPYYKDGESTPFSSTDVDDVCNEYQKLIKTNGTDEIKIMAEANMNIVTRLTELESI